MNALRKLLIATAVSALLFMPFAFQAGAAAPGPKVSEVSVSSGGNKHNLSAKAWPNAYPGAYNTNNLVSNPNTTYKATDDPTGNPKGQQICIFCHTPHSANVEGGAPLWNRAFSTQTFSRYSSATLQIRLNSATRAAAGYDTSAPAWQPDGSSKLCLSCHDGVSSLGAVLNGGPIAMINDVITSIASFNPSNNKMKTGHHPVSFVYDAAVRDAINAPTAKGANTYKLPSIAQVKRDKNNKMQCTTCHDAHQNQTDDDDCYGGSCVPTSRKKAPFWVYGPGSQPVAGSGVAPTDRDAVCAACHLLSSEYSAAPSWP